jgi:hypothetical protein
MAVDIQAVLDKLSARERYIVECLFGIDRDRMASYAEIGKSFGGREGKTLSRQRILQIINSVRKRIGSKSWDLLEVSFPGPGPSPEQLARETAKIKQKVLGYLRKVGSDDALDYAAVHKLLGVPMPDHRPPAVVEYYSELASCLAFFQDYNARMFGRYKYCTKCERIRPIGEFYILHQGYHWQICKECNTKRCSARRTAKRLEETVDPESINTSEIGYTDIPAGARGAGRLVKRHSRRDLISSNN